jgi:carboxylesterase type B
MFKKLFAIPRYLFIGIYLLLCEIYIISRWIICEIIWDALVLPLAERCRLSSFFIQCVQLDTGIAVGKRWPGYIKFEAILYGQAERFKPPTKMSPDFARKLNVEPTCFPQTIRGSTSLDVPVLKSYLRNRYAKQTRGFLGSEAIGHQLNIWTPTPFSPGKNLRPVLVFFHGGAFVFSSCHQSLIDGTSWAKNRGYCVVTANYRLGIFGYCCHPEMDQTQITANCGLLDQIFVLEWIQENIAKFGGDPNSVCIAGQSAGSWSVTALASIEGLANRLFHKVVCLSGGNLLIQSTNQARMVYNDFAKYLKFVSATEEEDEENEESDNRSKLEDFKILHKDPKYDHQQFARQLKSLSALELLHIQNKVEKDVTLLYRKCKHPNLLPFNCTIDGKLLKKHPLVQMKESKVNIPVFAGTTDTEYTFFTALAPSVKNTAPPQNNKKKKSYVATAPPVIDEAYLLNRLRQWVAPAIGVEGAEVSDADLQNLIDTYKKGQCKNRMGNLHPNWVAINGDFIFRVPVENFATRVAENGGKNVYVYNFADSASLVPALKAAHCVDLPYFFDRLMETQVLSGLWTPKANALKNEMMDALDNFMSGNYSKLWKNWNHKDRPTYFFNTLPKNNKRPPKNNSKSWHYSGLVLNPDEEEIRCFEKLSEAVVRCCV